MPATLEVPKTDTELGPHAGRSLSRVDGPLKVTGRAMYAGEFTAPGLTHGYVVTSKITRGKIVRIDTSAALALPGVLHVFTHENRPNLAWFDKRWKDGDSPGGKPFRPLYDAEIQYAMQPVALVVAETFEVARAAARLVHVEYESSPHQTNLHLAEVDAREPDHSKGGFQPPPKPRGDPDAAFAAAPVKIDVEYTQPAEHHNPMEMFATTVVQEDDDTLTIYDKTQGVQACQQYVCNVFGLKPAKVKVISPFVGGAFGSGLRVQFNLFMATMAAIALKRSVRVEMTRPQMFSFGHRPEVIQKLRLACDNDGKLQAVMHEAVSETSKFEDYVEIVVNWSGESYQCDNVRLAYKVAELDVYTPLDMRAPGAVTGVYALECAMDELAAAANMDPVEFRLKNYAEIDQNTGKPFSSKALRECYRQGADKFGWHKRVPNVRSMRDGKHLIGYGMAGGVWDAMQNPANAKAVLSINGSLVVSSATADIGTGTYTAMVIIAAESLGLPVEKVTFKLGDSSLPTSPLEGGSWTVSSVGTAVKGACDGIGDMLFKMAKKVENSPLKKAKRDDVLFSGGAIRLRTDPSKSVTFTEAMRAGGVLRIEQLTKALPNLVAQSKVTSRTHCATFVEVRVDESLGTIGVSRIVSAIAAGRIISAKTARSQIVGAAVFGVGMALFEETFMDHKLGRFMNHDLAEYHMASNADIDQMDVIFVEEHDTVVNPLGAKGVGEIGIVGVAAAIANAVYHATGKRVRSLPITPDKLL